MARLKDKYKKEVIPKMKQEFGYLNDLEVPRLQKVVINSGVGRFSKDPKVLHQISHALSLITGQKPISTVARKSISGFKIRQGMAVGFMVTLRGRRMYEFLDKLVNIVLPRVRDFRGLNPSAFDDQGNYTIGISEHTVFPEISYEDLEQTFSLEISIVTTAKDDKKGKRLLEFLGFPFRH
jgi:large subunit ribosomal protein L5